MRLPTPELLRPLPTRPGVPDGALPALRVPWGLLTPLTPSTPIRPRPACHRLARPLLAALTACHRLARPLLAALTAGLVAASAAAAPKATPIEGVINRIIDGDTLTLQPQGKPPIEVRLRDMDAPEICQPHGPEAKQALERLALGKTATLSVSARDQFGRSIGLVMVDGQSLSKLMVAEGHAWSTRGRYDRGPLMKEERMAIALRRGLHATQGAVMPKDFRKTNGPCK